MSPEKGGLDPEFLKALVCPECKGGLDHRKQVPELYCAPCRRGYAIRNGIPDMVVDASRRDRPS